MTVWLNNPFDNLEEEGARPQRYAMLSRELVKRGHEVIWWTSDFSHVHKKCRTGIDGNTIAQDYVNQSGVHMLLIKTKHYHSNMSFKRIASHRAYANEWLKLASSNTANGSLRKPDLIITSLPPLSVHSAAVKLRDKFGCKIIVDVQDAWPEAILGLLPKPFASIFRATIAAHFRAKARLAYCSADAITSVAKSYLTLARKYGATCPMHDFRLGITTPQLKETPPSPLTSEQPDTPLRLVYGGNMGKSYDLSTLISAVKCANAKVPGSVTLDIAGAGQDEQRLKCLSGNAPEIHFNGFLDKDQYSALLNRCEIGVVPMFNGSCVAFPNKIADYAAAGLATLCSLTGEARETLSSYNAGICYRECDVNGLTRILLDLADNRSKVHEMRKMSHTMLKNEFSAESIYPKMCEFIERIF